MIHDEYKKSFFSITGKLPYNYQNLVAEKILALDKNLLLVAPTGYGKTWTAIVPFLYSLNKESPIADRLIYVLPLRSLASSLYLSTKEALKNAGLDLDIRLQTGEQRDDPFFQGDIIFTTIDQALSGLLTIPVSLPPRLGNIVAGSFIGAYVIFDEIHLMETYRSFATTVVLSEKLNAVTRFLYMSATVPELLLKDLSVRLNAENMILSENDFKDIPIQNGKKRFFSRAKKPLSPEMVFARHNKRSMVICNTVSRAQEMAIRLNNLKIERGLNTEVILLHSRFLPGDRKGIEGRLTDLFGPPDKRLKDADAILVSTQVVEAGLDISCENLHTEIAPANSIIQRAGRCARYSGEDGKVWIYPLQLKDDGKFTSTTPYKKELVESTWNTLIDFQDKGHIDFKLERELLEKVHGKRDLDSIKKVDWAYHRREMKKAWQDGDYSLLRRLIRDIDSVPVLVHDNPEKIDLRHRPEFLSVPRSTLLSWWNDIPEEKRNGAAKAIYLDDKEERESEWQWRSIDSKESLLSAPFLVALNPDLTTYSPLYGLILTHGGDYRTVCQGSLNKIELYSYKRESFSEHIERILKALKAQTGKRIARKKLSHSLNLEPKVIKKLEELTAVLHDTGKLTVLWQKAAASWQEARNGVVENEFLAHTDYNPYNHWDKENRHCSVYKMPPHSVEGAMGVYDLVNRISISWTDNEVWEIAALSVLSAITCHHSSNAKKLKGRYRYHAQAGNIMIEIMRRRGLFVKKWSPQNYYNDTDINDFSQVIKRAISEESMLMYWHLARCLRLADQKSFEVVI